jgi:hypothetical protein
VFTESLPSNGSIRHSICVLKVMTPYHSKHLTCAWYEENVTNAVCNVQNGKLLTYGRKKEQGMPTRTLRQHFSQIKK